MWSFGVVPHDPVKQVIVEGGETELERAVPKSCPTHPRRFESLLERHCSDDNFVRLA